MSQKLPEFASTALVAVGSNTRFGGNTLISGVTDALETVEQSSGLIRHRSRFFSTPAFPEGSGPDFVNAAFMWCSNLATQQIIDVLHDVETRLGRIREERWGARTIDLDLIAVADAVLPDATTQQAWMDLPLTDQQRIAPSELILPHPRMHERAFVLVPLCDIAPDWRHPVLGQTAQQLLDALPQAERDSVKPLENLGKRA